MTNETIGEAAFETLAGTPETPAEARNGIRHVVSLSLTKLADGLINPKLVLSYLLNASGHDTFWEANNFPNRLSQTV